MSRKWKGELTGVLGRCVQSQDRNLWIANILNLVEQELDKAREEGFKNCLKEVEAMSRFSARKEIDLSRDEAFKRLSNVLESKLELILKDK